MIWSLRFGVFSQKSKHKLGRVNSLTFMWPKIRSVLQTDPCETWKKKLVTQKQRCRMSRTISSTVQWELQWQNIRLKHQSQYDEYKMDRWYMHCSIKTGQIWNNEKFDWNRWLKIKTNDLTHRSVSSGFVWNGSKLVLRTIYFHF